MEHSLTNLIEFGKLKKLLIFNRNYIFIDKCKIDGDFCTTLCSYDIV